MKDLHLLVHSPNSILLGETLKGILEETGFFRIHLEKPNPKSAYSKVIHAPALILSEPGYPKISSVGKTLTFRNFVLNLDLRTLQWKQQQVFRLSYRECRILGELVENTGKIVSRNFLLYQYYGEVSYFKSRSLDVLVSKLRKYLHCDSSVTLTNFRNEGLSLSY
ncbi:MAG: winged helix-turn-helix domain-containing protein [Dysgonamonadaceae bacterium]|jgi:DNA-binding response OmpR family regulator|nr:winged helix-turn-helix domain-containing protein [Dysgonamonadaceae bacterium]